MRDKYPKNVCKITASLKIRAFQISKLEDLKKGLSLIFYQYFRVKIFVKGSKKSLMKCSCNSHVKPILKDKCKNAYVKQECVEKF